MRSNRVTKSSRRPNRRIDEDQLAAHFAVNHGNTGDENVHPELYSPAAAAHDGDTAMNDFREEEDDDSANNLDLDHDRDNHQQHGPLVDDALEHSMEPMAPMTPSHHQHHHHHHHEDLDALTAPELRNPDLLYAAAAASDLQQPASPLPLVGNTMPALQPLVAATDFQPDPSPTPPPPQPRTASPESQPHFQPAPPPPPRPPPLADAPPAPHPPAPAPQTHSHQHQHSPSPPEQTTTPPPPPSQKTTEQMALVSGYEGFKVDSAFAKRMSRDLGQRLAEQRREGQELNLVRRSNVEALLAQIAGTEAANSCMHCKKGQGPWTVCVVYSGQMMGSCANCWFNASGSRCSFHEKSQPPQPIATHPYAVPMSLPGTAPLTTAAPGAAANGDPAAAVVGSSSSKNNNINSNSAYVVNHGASPAHLQATALWNASGAVFSHDAGVKGTVQSALLQVREATPYQRALIQVEVAAKQLALKIVEAEELALGLGHDGAGGDEDAGGMADVGSGGHDEGAEGTLALQHRHQHQEHQLHHHHRHEYGSPPDGDVIVDGRS